ncbi:MAG: zinc ABC transporter substrate-binding protein ZnuA, partial [Enterovibrio sp.]
MYRFFISFTVFYALFFSFSVMASDAASLAPQKMPRAPLVLVTVKPLAMIAKEIAGSHARIEQLLPNTASVHDYALKPSDLRKIEQADLVIWVGAPLEQFLAKLLYTKPKALTLLNVPQMQLAQSSHAPHEHGENHDHFGHEHAHDHEDALVDPHIWLGPLQATLSAKAIADRLSAEDPANKAHYQANYLAFAQNVQQKVTDIKQQLQRTPAKGYIVFHDAYGYFEKTFGLAAVGHLTVTPERKSGAKTLLLLQKELDAKKVHCIFSEPQFNPSLVNKLVEKSHAEVVMLDPLGQALDLNKDRYVDFLQAITDSFVSCFTSS